jgi:hypothetical protein
MSNKAEVTGAIEALLARLNEYRLLPDDDAVFRDHPESLAERA